WPDMLEIRNAPFSLRILTCAVLLGIATPGAPALAQTNEDAMAQMNQDGPPQQGAQGNPICIRLEGQLATIDRGAGTGDPAKDEQIRRYQEAQAKQQAELDRVTLQAKRMGCESSGFFSLFNGRSAQCGPVNNQIQQMRANLGAPSGTFRTVCVRTCDGGYFPVSFATYQARFQDDERTCKSLCPATE